MGRYANGLFAALIISGAMFVAGPTLAASLTADQLQQVTSLLTTLNVDAQKIKAIEAILKEGSSDGGGVAPCVQLSRDIGYGARDTALNGEVASLQKVLGVSPTGYFGPMTQEAVKKWQAANGVVSSGTPSTTGYGFVGPRTRAAFGRLCVNPTEQKISFTANPATAMVNTQTVNFSALPEKGIAVNRYYIEFGDGTQAEVKEQPINCITTPCIGLFMTASHVYTQQGTYTATLHRRYVCNASEGQSCVTLYSEEVAKTTVTIVTNTPPSPPISFTATPLQGTVPITVGFTAKAEPSVSTDRYYVAFGDGAESGMRAYAASCAPPAAGETQQCDGSTYLSATHTYTTAGEYSAVLYRRHTACTAQVGQTCFPSAESIGKVKIIALPLVTPSQ